MALSVIDPPDDDRPVLVLADFQNMSIIINATVKRNAFKEEELDNVNGMLSKIENFVKHIKKIRR